MTQVDADNLTDIPANGYSMVDGCMLVSLYMGTDINFQEIQDDNHIKSLRLFDCKMTPSFKFEIPKVKELQILGTQLTENQFLTMCESKELSHLSVDSKAATPKKLAEVIANHRLEVLFLSGFDDLSALSSAPPSSLSSLKSISLSQVDIDDEFCKLLCSSKNLQYLSLVETTVSADCLEKIRKMNPNNIQIVTESDYRKFIP